MKIVKLLMILTASALLLSACSKNTWEGFIFHNRYDKKKISTIGTFDSLKACREAAINTLKTNNLVHSGDYACGLNCKNDTNNPNKRNCEKMER